MNRSLWLCKCLYDPLKATGAPRPSLFNISAAVQDAVSLQRMWNTRLPSHMARHAMNRIPSSSAGKVAPEAAAEASASTEGSDSWSFDFRPLAGSEFWRESCLVDAIKNGFEHDAMHFNSIPLFDTCSFHATLSSNRWLNLHGRAEPGTHSLPERCTRLPLTALGWRSRHPAYSTAAGGPFARSWQVKREAKGLQSLGIS